MFYREKICDNCKKSNKETEKFCMHCGMPQRTRFYCMCGFASTRKRLFCPKCKDLSIHPNILFIFAQAFAIFLIVVFYLFVIGSWHEMAGLIFIWLSGSILYLYLHRDEKDLKKIEEEVYFEDLTAWKSKANNNDSEKCQKNYADTTRPPKDNP